MHKNQHENFAPEKQQKRGKRTRFSQKKAKPGAFWVLEGMGTVVGRCERMGKPGNRAEGLVSPAGSGGSRQSATGARSPLGTRFWSGCGNSAQRAGEGQGCAVLKRAVLVWCCQKKRVDRACFCHLSQNDCFYLRFVL